MIYRKLTELKKLEGNPRTITKDDMEKLVASIKASPDYFEARPLILSDRTGELVILGGNQRYEAAKLAGLKEVPTHLIPDLTEEREREIIIRDNVANGAWDWGELANSWDLDDLEEWGLDIPADLSEPDEVEEDEAPEVSSELPVSQLGSIYQLGRHRVMCGDSTDAGSVALLMDGVKADMVFTDPPYGMHLNVEQWNTPAKKGQWVSNKKDYTAVIGDGDDFDPRFISIIFELFGKCKEIFLWGGDYYAELLDGKNDGSWVVWDKRAGGLEDVQWSTSEFELCWSKQKHQRKIARFRWMGVHGMETQDTDKRIHPTQKPVELCAWFMKNWGKENDNLVDLFLGSGSTLIACEQTDRTCYGMELDPKYTDVIRKRWAKYVHGEAAMEDNKWVELTPVIA